MAKQSRACAECGNRFISEQQMVAIGETGGVGVRSDLFPEMCEQCEVIELQRKALSENVRRLNGWAEKQGRRHIAERLVAQFDKYGLGSRQRHHVRWAFLYEMTGDQRELVKLVERLMPAWGSRVVITDPIMGATAEYLQNRH